MTEEIDFFISHLQRHLELLDAEIESISQKIAKSNDPEGDGYYDSAEYFMGAGLVAVQKYMTETFLTSGVEQKIALDAGPKLAGEVPFASVVWSAANCWKHDSEWWKEAIQISPPNSDGMSSLEIGWPEGGKSERNIRILREFGRLDDYICSIVLAELSGEKQALKLQSVLPYLRAWRDAINQIGQLNAQLATNCEP